MYSILVTGANGQLGHCLRELSKLNKQLSFNFLTREELDITNEEAIKNTFENNNFNYCINCAAYTAVDKAEADKEKAYEINVLGVRYLSRSCKNHNIILIHISTDYVFNGKNYKPYRETDITNPASVYGKTKQKGEEEVINNTNTYFIIRTSWLYSEYGNNFVKTMLKLSKVKKELKIISDQVGSPTYAGDLAELIVKIIYDRSKHYGVYNYSNEGIASWYDFANVIFEIENKSIKVEAVTTENYHTPAKRPHYSVLNKSKIKETLKIEIPSWRVSLKECLSKITKD